MFDFESNRENHRKQLGQMTDAQLIRLYCELRDRMTEGDGYQPFGYDLTTLWATHPQYMEHLCMVRHAYNVNPLRA